MNYTDKEVEDYELDIVNKWLKRTERKIPYYLVKETKDGTLQVYHVIWNDGDKTKYGTFKDSMRCRDGVNTITVLSGNTAFDLWNSKGIDDTLFNQMLAVRKKESDLPHFDPRTSIKDLSW